MNSIFSQQLKNTFSINLSSIVHQKSCKKSTCITPSEIGKLDLHVIFRHALLVRTLQFSHGDSQVVPSADEVAGRYCFQSCLSVHICRQADGLHSTDMRSKYHFMIFTYFVNMMILIEGIKIVVFNKPLFVFAFAFESNQRIGNSAVYNFSNPTNGNSSD